MSWNGFGGLDLTTVEAQTGRKTLTPGSHHCKIVSAEVRQTKDKTGHALAVEFQAVDGTGSVEDFINLNNRNDMAERIGKERLKALLIAAKHPNPNRPGDVKSLIGLEVGVHVEEGESWVNAEGKTVPGGGKPRKSGAYYKVGSEAPAGGGTNGGGYGGYGDLNDDIPF